MDGRRAYSTIHDANGVVTREQTMIENPFLSLHPRKIDERFLIENTYAGPQKQLAQPGLPENKAALHHQCNTLPKALDWINKGDMGPLGAASTCATMGWACPLLQTLNWIDSVSRGAVPNQALFSLTTYASCLVRFSGMSLYCYQNRLRWC